LFNTYLNVENGTNRVVIFKAVTNR